LASALGFDRHFAEPALGIEQLGGVGDHAAAWRAHDVYDAVGAVPRKINLIGGNA
jgi:hypothetical protein